MRRSTPTWHGGLLAGAVLLLVACADTRTASAPASTAALASTDTPAVTAAPASTDTPASTAAPASTVAPVGTDAAVVDTVPPAIRTLLLVDGLDPEAPLDWQVVNDGVMGGVSSSTVTASTDGVVFAGSVSLDNNGGFASIRNVFAEVVDLATFGEVVVEAVGDGKTYVVELRTERDDVTFWQRFTATPGTTSFVLPLDGFLAHTRFGEPITAGPAFDSSTVRSIAVYILDKQVGEFRIVIRRISAR